MTPVDAANAWTGVLLCSVTSGSAWEVRSAAPFSFLRSVIIGQRYGRLFRTGRFTVNLTGSFIVALFGAIEAIGEMRVIRCRANIEANG
jgi:fluoride ion exporter CrcB/FEX